MYTSCQSGVNAGLVHQPLSLRLQPGDGPHASAFVGVSLLASHLPQTRPVSRRRPAETGKIFTSAARACRSRAGKDRGSTTYTKDNRRPSLILAISVSFLLSFASKPQFPQLGSDRGHRTDVRIRRERAQHLFEAQSAHGGGLYPGIAILKEFPQRWQDGLA